MYLFCMAAVTKCHKFGGLKQHTLSYCSRVQKAEISLPWPKTSCHWDRSCHPETLRENLFSWLFMFLVSHCMTKASICWLSVEVLPFSRDCPFHGSCPSSLTFKDNNDKFSFSLVMSLCDTLFCLPLPVFKDLWLNWDHHLKFSKHICKIPFVM